MESEVGEREAKSCWVEQGMRKRETKWEARLEKRDNFITFHCKLLHYFLQFTTSIKNLRGKRKHGVQKYDYSFAANFRCIFSRFESEFLKEKDFFNFLFLEFCVIALWWITWRLRCSCICSVNSHTRLLQIVIFLSSSLSLPYWNSSGNNTNDPRLLFVSPHQ